MENYPFLGLLALLLVAAPAGTLYWPPRFLLSWIARRYPGVRFTFADELRRRDTKGEVPTCREKLLALTIDDAISTPRTTHAILDVLKRHGAAATFFVIGCTLGIDINGGSAGGAAAVVERIRAEGHELGNHLEKDEASYMLTEKEFDRQLADVDAVIFPKDGASGGLTPWKLETQTKWFRPGCGFFHGRMVEQARRAGYTLVLGDNYPHDPVFRSARLNSWFIRARARPGGIVIIHDRPWTVDLLERLLPRLAAGGYRLVTLSEMQKYTGNKEFDPGRKDDVVLPLG